MDARNPDESGELPACRDDDEPEITPIEHFTLELRILKRSRDRLARDLATIDELHREAIAMLEQLREANGLPPLHKTAPKGRVRVRKAS